MIQRTLFPDEPKPPANATDTSKAAARKVPNTAKQRNAILAYLIERGEYGATDEELQAHFGLCAGDEVRWPLSNGNTLRP